LSTSPPSASRDALAAIFGCAGLRLSEEERAFFRKANPYGFILFARNVETPDQVRALVRELRDAVGRADAPLLIDQEGGRVQRLKPPQWRGAPAGRRFGELMAHDPQAAEEGAQANARLIAAELDDLGIDVDCLPLLDVPVPGAHDIIGDRAFGETPDVVAQLGRAVCKGLRAGGVLPIVKHVPGHGRARSDSHLELPVVDASLDELRATDFAPFKALAKEACWAMTAHVVYTAIDPDAPATLSAKVVREIIRGEIGFDGPLISDDLSMKALSGDFAERTRLALAAGCDLVLHCNGDMAEMTAVAAACAPLSQRAVFRLTRATAAAERQREADPSKIDRTALLARLDALLGAVPNS
jgi:beta-N-acetylhexosaminidase